VFPRQFHGGFCIVHLLQHKLGCLQVEGGSLEGSKSPERPSLPSADIHSAKAPLLVNLASAYFSADDVPQVCRPAAHKTRNV